MARGEVIAFCLLSQLWPAAPTTAGNWRNEQTRQGTERCLDSGCGQQEVEEGEMDLCMFLTRSNNRVLYVLCEVYTKLLLLPSLHVLSGEWYSTASLGSFNHCLLPC